MAESNGAISTEELSNMVKEAADKRTTTINTLQTAQTYHQGELSKIDAMLTAILGSSPPTPPAPAPITAAIARPLATAASPSAGRGVGPRNGNETTITGGVETLALKYADGLSASDFTSKLLSEMGYKTDNDAKTFGASVYTNGINKLCLDGTLVPVGPRKSRKYKHRTNCTAEELTAAK